MAHCPICHARFAFYKTWMITKHNAIICEYCGGKLRTGRFTPSLVAGIGGGIGAAAGCILFRTRLPWQGIMLVFLLWAVTYLTLSSLFDRLVVLEDKDNH